MKLINCTISAGLVLLAPFAVHAGSLSQLSNYSAVSAEIMSFDKATGNLLATAETQVEVINFSTPSALSRSFLVSFDNTFDAPAVVSNVSSVAADPLGRGIGAVVLINDYDTTVVGKVVLFDTASGALLASFDVGYHPDCVNFSDDGEYVVVANEGEWSSTGTQTPGSVSVLTIGASTTKAQISSLAESACVTYDFSNGNLAAGVSYTGLRVSDPSGEGLPFGLEPEYVSCIGGKVYVGMQEASAIGVLDIASGKWTAIYEMPAIFQTIDASDKDSGVNINDSCVACLPMPDTIAAFESGGHVYIATANEGDFRPDDGDKSRVSGLGSGAPALDADYLAYLNSLYAGNALANSALGRLNVSTIDGLNSDGEIEQLYLPGTRSFSIVDAETGVVIFDSGSDFETLTAKLDADGFDDGRSDDKGPEPEGLCVFEIGSQRYIAIVMERTYGIFLYNITDPTAPVFADYIRATTGDKEPECIRFVPASLSPDGAPKLVVSYEASCTINVFGIALWNDFPSSADSNGGGAYVNTFGWMGTLYVSGNYAYSWDLDAWLYMPQSFISEIGAWTYIFK